MPEQKDKTLTLRDGTPLAPLISQILEQRNIQGQAAVSDFLEPKLQDLPDPFLMKDMEKAVNLIGEGIEKRWPLLIVGDYDVDGTTATALLLRFFNWLGCEASFYIPNRLTEGYGLQTGLLRKIDKQQGDTPKILVTVDNGISAHEAVALAVDLGYRTIVTDHHTPPPDRVPADAVLNPKQEGCQFPDKNLAGVGVAFYLAMGLRSYLNRRGFFTPPGKAPNLKELLDLVAVGTVADMVPLLGVNRTLVKAGMETMALQSNHGLTALCRVTNIDCSFVRSEDISFQLAPKINAVGRLGRADKAVSLFLSGSKEEALAIAGDLVESNKKRQAITLDNFINAEHQISKADTSQQSATLISGEFHLGVAGIVASNLVEAYGKPAIVLCDLGDGPCKGSARSVAGVDLYRALADCSDLLQSFGGHPMAAGLSLRKNNLEAFEKSFNLAVSKQNKGKVATEENGVDADIPVHKLFSGTLLRQLHTLEPFGQSNPQPIFRDTISRFNEATPIGKDKTHLRLSFNNGKTAIKGVAFGLGKMAKEAMNGAEKEILYTPSVNFFRGKRSWQVRVTSITVI